MNSCLKTLGLQIDRLERACLFVHDNAWAGQYEETQRELD